MKTPQIDIDAYLASQDASCCIDCADPTDDTLRCDSCCRLAAAEYTLKFNAAMLAKATRNDSDPLASMETDGHVYDLVAHRRYLKRQAEAAARVAKRINARLGR